MRHALGTVAVLLAATTVAVKAPLRILRQPVATTSLFLLLPAMASASPGWEALKEPGAVAIVRHALAPGTGDPPDFTLGDCSTQRNLDATGRAQARAIGDAIRALDVEIDQILTSEWCRCRETAELLGLGPVEAFPALNSFYADRSTRDVQTRRTRDFLAGLPEDARVVLVTHQVNITALTGRFAWSGEAIIFDVDPDGAIEILAEVAPAG